MISYCTLFLYKIDSTIHATNFNSLKTLSIILQAGKSDSTYFMIPLTQSDYTQCIQALTHTASVGVSYVTGYIGLNSVQGM